MQLHTQDIAFSAATVGTPILYALLTTAFYYLGARATITRVIWSRYPSWLDYYTMCAACSGFAYGLGVGSFGWKWNLSFLGLPGQSVSTVIVIGLCSMIWTPIIANKHIKALLEVSGTDERSNEDTQEVPITTDTTEVS